MARLVLAAALIAGACLRVANLDVELRSPDERIYAAQARAALEDGAAGTRRVAEAFRRNPQLWLYPPPTRMGYTYLLAAAMRVTGEIDERAGSAVSCVASILTLALAAVIGLRFFGAWIAALGVAMLAVFPPELVIARRCWTDAPVELATAAAMYFALEIWSGAKRWHPYVALPVAGSAAFLIKETTVLVYGPCFVLALWAVSRRRLTRRAAVLAGTALAGAGGALWLLAVNTGSAVEAVRLMADQARHNATNPYALEYASGPGYLLIEAFVKLSPLTFALALAGLAATLAGGGSAARVLAWLTIGNIALYAVVPHWLNVRYASASFAPLCLFAGVAGWGAAEVAKRRMARNSFGWAAAGGGLILAVFLVADYQRFENAFVKTQAMDLSVKMVFDAMESAVK